MQRLVAKGFDRVLGSDVTMSVGFSPGGEVDGIHGPMGPRTTAFGHPSAVGSIGFALLGRGRTLEICDLIFR